MLDRGREEREARRRTVALERRVAQLEKALLASGVAVPSVPSRGGGAGAGAAAGPTCEDCGRGGGSAAFGLPNCLR
eukprot:SAG11_NODE_23394_length_389_cov_1.068966_1_plen_75_part_10